MKYVCPFLFIKEYTKIYHMQHNLLSTLIIKEMFLEHRIIILE